MLFSIVIATIGRSSIIQSINSIKLDLEKLKIEFEIIVVIDGYNLAHDLLSELQKYDVVKLFSLQENSGPSAAFNFGITKSTGEFIGVFSDDDIWLEGRGEKLINSLNEGDVDVLLTRACYEDERGVLIRPSKHIFFENFLKTHYSNPLKIRNPYVIVLTTCIARREVWNIIKFNEDLRSHEDIWWLECVSKNGFTIVLLDEITVFSNGSFERSAKRFEGDVKSWIDCLLDYDVNIAKTFIWRHLPKNLAFTGNLNSLFPILKYRNQIGMSVVDFFFYFTFISIGILRRIFLRFYFAKQNKTIDS